MIPSFLDFLINFVSEKKESTPKYEGIRESKAAILVSLASKSVDFKKDLTGKYALIHEKILQGIASLYPRDFRSLLSIHHNIYMSTRFSFYVKWKPRFQLFHVSAVVHTCN
jgi:hypothetical protein